MYIIGIAGGTGSGKTTVVKKIAKVLPPIAQQLFLLIRTIMILQE